MRSHNPADPPAGTVQVLVRLPEDLAARFACLVPSRKRSRFLVDLLRKELDRESQELSLAAKRLTELESQDRRAQSENQEWIDATLTSESDGLDVAEFERQFHAAQALVPEAQRTPTRA